MNLVKLFLCIFVIFLLEGCMLPASKQILPEVKYHSNINFHINKDLLIDWKTGYVVAANHSFNFYGSGIPGLIGLGADIVGIKIIAHENDHISPNNLYQFGEYRQAIFMSSLYKILKKNHVFHSINFVSHHIKHLKANQILLTVNFKSTKVSSKKKYQVTLDALVSLKSKHKTLHKLFFIQSPIKNKNFSIMFKEHQIIVANKLMHNIIDMIRQSDKLFIANYKSKKIKKCLKFENTL